MHVFMVYVRDENFCQLLLEELNRSRSDDSRIKVLAFPPLGIQTLAPVLRRHGHQLRQAICPPGFLASLPHLQAPAPFRQAYERSDIFKLLWSPFRRRTLSRSPELPDLMIDLRLKEPLRDIVSIT
jgi:hypothetical protein